MKETNFTRPRCFTPLSIGFLLVVMTCSCSAFTNRSFIDEMERGEERFLVPGNHFPTVAGDSGRAYRSADEISSRTPASGRSAELSRHERSVRHELNRRLNQLPENEYNQYRVHKQYLSTAPERIYYLELSPRDRAEYIRLRGFNPSVTENEIQELRTDHMRRRALSQYQRPSERRTPQSVDSDDSHEKKHVAMGMSFYETRSPKNAPVEMGMTKDQVIHKWGQPSNVEVAGHPRNENERWSFHVAGKVRQIYFASGRVEGWVLE